jgi:hypothetical protein
MMETIMAHRDQPDQGWRDHVLNTLLPRNEATTGPAITGFTPGPANPQPLNFGAPHIAPPNDPTLLLEGLGLPLVRFTALRQRALDLYNATPTYEQVQEVRLEALGYKNRIADLERHRSEGGFGLPEDAPQIVSEKRKLVRAEKELARLTELKETRTVFPNDRRSFHAGRDLLEQLQVFRARAVFEQGKSGHVAARPS